MHYKRILKPFGLNIRQREHSFVPWTVSFVVARRQQSRQFMLAITLGNLRLEPINGNRYLPYLAVELSLSQVDL